MICRAERNWHNEALFSNTLTKMENQEKQLAFELTRAPIPSSEVFYNQFYTRQFLVCGRLPWLK